MNLKHSYFLLAFFFVSCNAISDKKGTAEEANLIREYRLPFPKIEVKDDIAYVSGTLGKLFYDSLEKVITKNPQIRTLVLLDVPGSVDDYWNLKASKLVFENNLNTELLPHSIVESGRTDLFVSGKNLIVADGAKIGVHAWAGDDIIAKGLPKNHTEHQMFINFYRTIEIDTSFYWFTLKAAPADGMHFVTKEEINAYFKNKLN